MSNREYICDVCGHQAAWTDDWMWWGSLADAEEGAVVHICSEKCRVGLDGKKLRELRKRAYGSVHCTPAPETKQNLRDRESGADLRIMEGFTDV